MESERIYLYKMADLMVPGAEILYMQQFDLWKPLSFYIFAMRINGKNILINSGLPRDTTQLENFWITWDKRATLTKYSNIEDVMRKLEIKPADIDYVFVTPLASYATGNLDIFDNARIVIYRDGWIDYMAPSIQRGVFSNLPDEIVMPNSVLCYLVMNKQKLLLVNDGDYISEISARIQFGGVHHRSSMIISFNINNRTVAFTDSVFTYENIDKRTPIGILENVDEAYRVFEIIKTFDIVIPIFDPTLDKKYEGGISLDK
ncbi:MAG: hypothetical protein QXQ46_06940 [Thermoplasmatales archaeon]